MKHPRKKYLARILATAVLFSLLLCCKSMAAAETDDAAQNTQDVIKADTEEDTKEDTKEDTEEDTIEGTVITEEKLLIHEKDEDAVKEYKVVSTNIKYEKTSHYCTIPAVKLNGTWMIPAKTVLSDILGCYYQLSTKKQTILVKSPDRKYTITFNLNSTNAIVNKTKKTLSHPVVLASMKQSSESDYMIPLNFAIKKLGYTYTFEKKTGEDGTVNEYSLQIQSAYLFSLVTGNLSYNTEKYNNALSGIILKKNEAGTKNYIQGVTLKEIAQKNVVVSQDAKNYTVTLKYLKTYNPFGTTTKTIKNGITKSIKVWKTADYAACVRITYEKKYVYSQSITTDGGKLTLLKGTFSMKIALPDGVAFSKVTTTDQYWNQQFLITIPGNHVSFYKKYAPFDNSSYITGISVAKKTDGNTKITVKTKGLKGYKLTAGEGCFTVKVGNPKDIYQNIVVLDAGHGGKDSGALKGGLLEKNVAFSIIYTQIEQYFENSESTVKAYWTRHDDTFINLYARPTYSAKYQADLFVSLHMNSADSSSANGTEVYYSKQNNKKDFSGITSKLFAQKMQNTLVSTLGTKNRGVKQAGFVVIKHNTVPSILIELGFITGSSDHKKLKSTSFQKKAAKTIYQGICDTFKKYPTKR